MARAFVGLISRERPEREAFARRLHARQRCDAGFEIVYEDDALIVAAQSLGCIELGVGRGVILGRIAPADFFPGPKILTASEMARIAETRGALLIEGYWGGYVAVLPQPDGAVDLLRAPLGDLPCYLSMRGAAAFFSSSARLLGALSGAKPRVSWPALARHMAFPMLRRPETCLEGISEIPGGDRLTLGQGEVERTTLWSPWDWTVREKMRSDPAEAEIELYRVAHACVTTAVRGHGPVMLKLSGGLDSSIVAACLARSKAEFSTITLATPEPSGDERDYARLVARHAGAPLVEAMRDPAVFKLECSTSRNLPRPSIPSFRQESDRLTHAAAHASGARLIVDGGGGDNVFCALQSAAPVADCLLMRTGWPMFGATAKSVASLANVSTVQVWHAGIKRALDGRRHHRWPADRRFLSLEAAASLPAQAPHPWLEVPHGALPGRAAHVGLIAAAQSYVEGSDPDVELPLLSPLLAQPLVETCLRIPSWHWFSDGLNRAVARGAFAADLPFEIVNRRSKGTPDAFVAAIFEQNRGHIRDRLLDGALAREGLVDPDALAPLLGRNKPVGDSHLHRLMALFDAAVWAQGWA